jgi:hypothetical protein
MGLEKVTLDIKMNFTNFLIFILNFKMFEKK